VKTIIAIVMALGAASVHAGEAYKCVGANGQAVFQNVPCGTEPKVLEQPKRPPVMKRARAMARLEQEAEAERKKRAEQFECPPTMACARLEAEIRADEERKKRLER
jgi:hypothetical protein